MIGKKLRALRVKHPQAFETLKGLSKSAKGYERNALPKNISYESLITLERYGFIFTYNFAEYAVLSNRVKSQIDKI